MSRKMISSLVLLGLAVVLLIINHGSVKFSLGFADFSAAKSFVFLGFLIIGLVSGVLLK